VNTMKEEEKAIEAWNTWKGRYVVSTPELFRASNPCNDCSKIMDGNKFNEPGVSDLVGKSIMARKWLIYNPLAIFNSQTSFDLRR